MVTFNVLKGTYISVADVNFRVGVFDADGGAEALGVT